MSGHAPSIADLRRTLRHCEARLRSFPHVVAVGIGGRVRGGRRGPALAIRVYVSRKLPRARLRKRECLPRRVRGRLSNGAAAPWFVPVDVVRGSGRLDMLALHGGQGVRGMKAEVGTIGLVYRSVEGRDYLLTNAHVAAGLDFGAGDLASRERAGESTALTRPSNGRAFADLERIVEIRSGAANSCDAALCWIYRAEQVVLRSIAGERVESVADVGPRSDETYFYVNRRGRKKTFDAPDERSAVDVTFAGRSVRFRRVITLTGVRGFGYRVEPGDSGSLLVRRSRQGLVAAGLVFAGHANTVAVLPLSPLLTKLGAAAASRSGTREDVRIDFDA